MKRNYVSAVLVAALGFVFIVLLTGGGLVYYLDLPSVIIVVIFPFLYQCFLYGPSATGLAFSAGFKKDSSMEQINKSELFFKSYGKITWIFVFVAVISGTIAILRNLEDPRMLGPNFSVALLSLLYGGLVHCIIIIPNSVFLKKRLTELSIEL
jgi:flagellar motor component MotA